MILTKVALDLILLPIYLFFLIILILLMPIALIGYGWDEIVW